MSNAKDLAKNYPYADLDGNNTFSGANTFGGNAEFSLAPTYQGQVNLGLGMDHGVSIRVNGALVWFGKLDVSGYKDHSGIAIVPAGATYSTDYAFGSFVEIK